MDIQILKEMLSEEKFNELNEALKDKEGKLADLGKSDYVSSAKYNALKTQFCFILELDFSVNLCM